MGIANDFLLTLMGAPHLAQKNARIRKQIQIQRQLAEMQPMGDAFANIQGESSTPYTKTNRMQFAKVANEQGQQPGDVFGGKSRRRHHRSKSRRCRSKYRRSRGTYRRH
jgi:hypothetical protein